MTTRDDIKKLMGYMINAFPNFNPNTTGETNAVDVFFDLLGDLPLETLKIAVKSACAEPGRAFAPSAGEIRGMAASLQMRAAGTPTAAEAWAAIMEWCHRVHPSESVQEILDHPIVQKATRALGGLDAIGYSEQTEINRAHFLKIYDQLTKRAEFDAAMLPEAVDFVGKKRLMDEGIKLLTDGWSVKK